MSRWVDQFQSHAFQNTWVSLKTALGNASVDDKTVVTSVKELARLRKVIAYIDEMLHQIDPELVPLSTWDNFNQQAAPCLQHIGHYNSNRNIGHIQNANAHADNLLTYIRPYMIVAGKTAKVLNEAIKNYAKTIDEYADSFKEKSSRLLNDITSDKEESGAILNQAKNIKQSIDSLEIELFGGDENNGIEGQIKELVSGLNDKYIEINGFYNETLIGDEREVSTKKAVLQAKETILAEKDKIGELLEAVTQEVKDLAKFHAKIFGRLDEDSKRVGGLSDELEKRIKNLSDFEVEQKDRYKALNHEIESLLPGATSAGLASAYREMKESFESPIRHASKVFYWSLGLLVLASLVLAIDSVGSENWITFVKFESWEVVMKGLVYKIPFYAPVLWLAFYATKRRSEYQRLQQEYAHKEALAKSYNSYKKQIEELGGEDIAMQKEFIMKTIDAIAYNASTTLDGKHGDKMPAQDMVEKLVDALAKFKSADKTKN